MSRRLCPSEVRHSSIASMWGAKLLVNVFIAAPPSCRRAPAAAGSTGGAARWPERRTLAGPVGRLVGRGPGLTPLGDDVLAGALVTLWTASVATRGGARIC